MKITANDKLKRSLIKKYWRETRKVLIKVRQPVMEMADNTGIESLKAMILHLLQVQPMTTHLVKLWEDVGGRYGSDTERKIRRGRIKSKLEEEELLEDWKRKMRIYSSERSLIKAGAILTTEQEAINKIIDLVIKESLDEGLGIIESRRLLKKYLQGRELAQIENWQAQRIAMTEVGQAQNTASYQAALGHEGVKKTWMFIPGLKTFRQNHKEFEAMGPQDMSFEYVPGLKHPGDENGAAEEVINCYCSIIYSID
jgi:hypothetical protein